MPTYETIATGAYVRIVLELFNQNEERIEHFPEEDPIEYQQGSEQLPPGLELDLEGKQVGSEGEITLEPEQAYGEHDPEGSYTVPLTELPEELDLIVGDVLPVTIESDEGEPMGTMDMHVLEVNDEGVVLDENHPLAGQTLRFRYRVLSIGEPPAEAEHVHDENCQH